MNERENRTKCTGVGQLVQWGSASQQVQGLGQSSAPGDRV